MDRRNFVVGAGSVAFFAPPLQTFARMGILLVRAEPGVGLTVTGPVRELHLFFDQGVLTVSSSVQVTNSAGVAIPTTKPIGDPSDQQIVIVHFRRVLLPDTYRVSWHVVSIDQPLETAMQCLRNKACRTFASDAV
jgi:copper resistance protein C